MPWHAVYTEARAEWGVEKRLGEQDFETLYLHYPDTISHARRKIGVNKPLFPRYLFVRVGEGQGVGTVRDTIGVNSILTGTQGLYEIPESAIDEMRSWGDAKGKCHKPDMVLGQRRLVRGAPVKITDPDSIARDKPAKVKLDTGESVHVLLEMLGGTVEMVFLPSGVEPVSPEWGCMDPDAATPRRNQRR